MIIEVTEKDKRERVCREILRSLPDWFGNPESVEEYALNCRCGRTWILTRLEALQRLGPPAAVPGRYM